MSGVSKEYIENTYKDKIDAYYNNWRRRVNLSIVPECLSVDDISNVLDIMVNRGLTFLAAYYYYKNPRLKMIYIDDITLTYKFYSSKVSSKKLDNKIKGLHIGLLNTVIINGRYTLLDGYAIYTVFKENNEIFVPCEFQEYVKSYKNNHNKERIKIRQLLYERANGKCYICGRQMVLNDDTEKLNELEATIDHVVPLSKGGTNDISNCAVCCSRCNRIKGDRILTDELKQEIKKIVTKK